MDSDDGGRSLLRQTPSPPQCDGVVRASRGTITSSASDCSCANLSCNRTGTAPTPCLSLTHKHGFKCNNAIIGSHKTRRTHLSETHERSDRPMHVPAVRAPPRCKQTRGYQITGLHRTEIRRCAVMQQGQRDIPEQWLESQAPRHWCCPCGIHQLQKSHQEHNKTAAHSGYNPLKQYKRKSDFMDQQQHRACACTVINCHMAKVQRIDNYGE